ncbi:glycerate kinase type-2 family protein [Marinibacterium sp. SX1]|uniref:glycerate kinase type-2 family protein n=1 Tax=Marinibacterium sp. SX1 TaxID=3388424 RepID=UPI003D169128
MSPEQLLRGLWDAGVDAVGGHASVARAVADMDRPDRIVAVGKAAGAMTRAALDRWPDLPALVVTKDGHADEVPEGATVIEAAHPVPDDRSLTGGRALLDCVSDMGPDSHLLLLVSGGASALAEAPVDGVSLDDLKRLNAHLLSRGLDITAMNAERRKVSRIKGGGLLRAFSGARATVLTISDVPGDDPAVIGSGIGLPPEAPDYACTLTCTASNAIARAAVAEAATAAGLTILSNSETLYDDVDELARSLGPRIAAMDKGVMIFGGEPTVHLPTNPGEGGRNQALALALSEAISGRDDITILVGGTDGTDGPTEAAGGIVTGATWGPGAAEALAAADSGTYLAGKDALLVSGPTGTNVMDVAIAIRV